VQYSNKNNYEIDARNVLAAFNAAAKDYDTVSLLQQTITDRLIESFDQIKINPAAVLDLGSGTGYGSRKLKQCFKKAHFYQMDISGEMINIARKYSPMFFSKNHFLRADASRIPLPNNHFDLVFSSLMLQWCNNLDAVFSDVRRVLKPGGIFLFTSFGPDTLKELRESWQSVDDRVHVNAFVDMHDIGDSLIRNGLDAPVLSVEHIVLTYDECKQLMRELKNTGAHNINNGRRKTLTGKRRLDKVIKHYETFRRDSKLPATYEVIYGHAWCPGPDRDINTGENVHSISLQDLKRDLKTRKPAQ